MVLDLQSGDLTVPARQEYDTPPLNDNNQSSRIRAIGWSPDSHWILLSHHIPLDSDTTLLHTRNQVVAVPATSINAALSGDPAKMSSEVVPLKYYDPEDGGQLSNITGQLHFVWLQ